jgi:hypothetical protein
LIRWVPEHAAALAGSPVRRRSRWRLALLLVLFVLLAGELVVRALDLVHVSAGARTPEQAAFNAAGVFVADDDLSISYRNRPLVHVNVAGVMYQHDEAGRRVMPPPPAADGSPPFEVAFLGDSTCYGLGLPAADTLPALVQEALGGRMRALNLGTCGYNTVQEEALYEAEREALRGVRVVVLLVYPNDFAPGTFLWDEQLHVMYVDPLPLPRRLKPWLWYSALYRALVSWRGSEMHAAGAFDPLRPGNHRQALEAVEKLAKAVDEDKTTLVVAHLPAMERLDPYLYAGPEAELRETCAQLGVAYVDLLQPFLAERERQIAAYEARGGAPISAEQRAGFLAQYWIGPEDHHLNAAGNRVAAGPLAEAIAQELTDAGQ